MKRIACIVLLLVLLAGDIHAHGIRKACSYDSWLFWWAYNRDDIVNGRARRQAAAKAAVNSGRPDHRLTDEDVGSRIVPALRQIIANRAIHPDIRGSALIALARARPADLTPDEFIAVAAADAGEEKLVRESATLALGIAPCRGDETREFLLALVGNRDEPIRLRGFAMITLGLLRDRSDEVFACLAARLDENETEKDAPVCALLAMGMIGDRRRVPTLLHWLENGRVDGVEFTDLTRSWFIAALGRFGDERAIEAVAAHLSHSSKFCRRSAVIAMGRLVPVLPRGQHLWYVQNLEVACTLEKDAGARGLTISTLGRIAAAPGVTQEAKWAARAFLVKQFREGTPTTVRPRAALALGLYGRSAPRDRRELAALIRPELARMEGDRYALGGLAISLGMLEDATSAPLLTRILSHRPNRPKLRACAATALAMIGDRTARDAVLSAVRERQDRDLRIDTATAAGILGDRRAAKHLSEVLSHPKSSQFTVGSVALALGTLADRRAVGPLLTILEAGTTEGTYPDLTRAFVVVALGQMTDRRSLRALFRFSRDINYRATVPALDEILCIL